MLEFEEFKIKVFNEFKKKYKNTILKKDNIIIQKGTMEATISVKDAYEEYRAINDFKLIVNIFQKSLQEQFVKGRFKVDYKKVYPMIKSKEFGKDEGLNFIREHLFLNLDILYVVDMGETFRFILEEDEVDFQKLKQSALDNLNTMSVELTRLDKDLGIYSVPFLTDYSSSYILLDRMQKIIERKVGKHYLIAIPSSTSILIAKNHPDYMSILKTLIDVDPDPHRVSNYIYRYRNGIYQYADAKNIFKIIK